MMNDNELRERLHHAMDTRLSGMTGDPWLAGRVMAETEGEKKVKKKVSLGLIVALVLLLAAVGALAVGALTGLFRLEQSDVGAMRGCVSMGDELYLMSSGGLCRWTPEDEEPTTLISSEEMGELGLSFEALPYLDDEGLALMDTEGKKIWRYRDGEVSLSFDYAGTPMDFPELRCQSAVYQDGWLFLRMMPPNATEYEATIYRADPLTGDAELLPITGVTELCGFEEGSILALQGDAEANQTSLIRMNAAAGDMIEALYTTSLQGIEGIAYARERGEVYALVGGELARWEDGDWMELQGYAPNMVTNAFAVVGEGYAMVSSGDMLYLPFMDQGSIQTLAIRGYIDDTDAAFQETYPGIAVAHEKDPSLTAADVKKAIEAGEATDIFRLRLDGDLFALLGDGLAAPLSSSEALSSDAREMLPAVRDGIFIDGELYAVPSDMLVYVWEADAVPETWEALIHRQNEWTEESPFLSGRWEGGEWTKREYADALLTSYIAERARANETMDFQDLADALNALREMDLPRSNGDYARAAITPNVIVSLHGESPADGMRDYPSEPTGALEAERPRWVLPPVTDASAERSLRADLIVYLINPNTQNYDLAIRYLEFAAAHRWPEAEAQLKPDLAQPTLYPQVEKMIDWFIEDQRAFDAEMGVDTDEAALQLQMDAIRSEPDSWAVTPNRLAIYQEEIAPYVDLRLSPLLSASAKREGGAYQRLLGIVMDFVEGDGSLEACMERMEGVLDEGTV